MQSLILVQSLIPVQLQDNPRRSSRPNADDADALLADDMCGMDVYHVYSTADDKGLKI